MVRSRNQIDKGVLQIDYNFMNQPSLLIFNQTYVPRNFARPVNIRAFYQYNASGEKLRKIYLHKNPEGSGQEAVTTDYLNGFQYESKQVGSNTAAVILKFVPTSEGYYNFENNKYIYSYTDHLGNIRVSYFKNTNGSAEVLEENNFYPFGMKHEGYNQTTGNPSYNYQYSGKELQKETGWSDFGARMYMSDIARWGVVDMKAEKYNSMSPYNYTANNPIIFIDPDGKDLIVTTFGDQQRVFDIFKNIIQNDFGNNVTVNIDKSGLVSFVLAEGAVLSGVQQRLYDAYSMLLAPGSKTTISLTEKSSKTLIGGFDISLGDDGKKYQNTVDLWDVQHAATENNLASTDIFHEAYESFLAQNVPEVASLSQDNAYDVVHPMAITKGDEIQGVKSGENKDGNINTKTMSFTNYQNFTDKNGNQMHRVVVYQNGNVVSSKEKKGNINLNEIQ